MHANHREDKDAAFTGDIVAIVGLKHSSTGDTLAEPALAMEAYREFLSRAPRKQAQEVETVTRRLAVLQPHAP